MKTNCHNCQNLFKGSHSNQKYCSHQCYSQKKVGEKHDWGIKISVALSGKKKSLAHVHAMSRVRLGRIRPEIRDENHYLWAGDLVGYDGIHDWVQRRLGKPKECVDCGESKSKLAWSNNSGNYLRELSDWSARCRKCHYQHDLKAPAKAFKYAGKGKMVRV